LEKGRLTLKTMELYQELTPLMPVLMEASAVVMRVV
jgi:hypothetical protein